MGLFYTGKGDNGESVVGQKRIDKTCVEVEALGDTDELNSLIGIVKNTVASDEFKGILSDAQEALFIAQANLAEFMTDYKFKAPELKAERIKKLEDLINSFESEVNPGKGFIISGSNPVSAWLDYARAVARRAERSAIKFSKGRKLAPEIISYLNRLSSLLFAMARVEAKRGGAKEANPQYK